jgi:exonuclease III
MKLISWNIRVLGGFEKMREVCQLVREKQPFILCIQETKLLVFDVTVCKSIWGDGNVDFSFQPLMGASEVLVTLWDTKEVEVWSSMSFEHVLVIIGRFLKTIEEIVLFNVYAPCDVLQQQTLWTNLSDRLGSLND